jgi:NAD(P)-dependent dehydrogenase (short-subunit alcohol dehydrogenase family)
LALITGAASGIGRAGALLFAREGAALVLTDIDRSGLDDVVLEVEAIGGTGYGIFADIGDPVEAKRIVKASVAQLGGLDVLWCNAGLFGSSEAERLTSEDCERTISVNQTSAILSSSEAIAPLRERGGGSIIFTASTSGIVGARSNPLYSASKFAIVGWTKSLALRVAPDKIRVNAICPGPINTPLMNRIMSEGAGGMSPAEYVHRVVGSVPLGRLGEPLEIAQAALWLASDDSSYVTGVALPVDGGYTSS